MGQFSLENLFGVTIRESANDGSDFTNPDADYRRLFLGEDGQLHVKDSAGTVTDIGGAASGSITASGYTQNTARLLGRTTASAGAIEEITVGSGLSLSAGSLTASGAGLTADDGPWWAPWAAPGSPDAANAEFTGSQLAGMTRVYNSGSAKGTWTEKFGAANYVLTTTGGNPELDVFAQSRSMSIGDYVEVAGAYPSYANYLGLFVGFADGATFGAGNVVGAFIHVDTGATGTRAILNIWDGYNTRTSDGTIFDTLVNKGVVQAWRVKYEAANTFGLYYSLDGVNWKAIQTNYAKTMTPSYVVFGASMLSGAAAGGTARIEYFRVNS